MNQLRQSYLQMKAKLFFVPNKIDVRIGTSEEMRMWKQTDEIFANFGKVTPRVTSRATLKRINTFELTNQQRDAVKDAFDYLIKQM
jgi:chromosome partitioning protein